MLTRDNLRYNISIVREKIALAAENSGRQLNDITIVGAIKTQPLEIIKQFQEEGFINVGENRVQELLSRYDSLEGLRWHFIGQLQTNKVKYIIDKVCLIHSLDRLALAEQLDKEGIKRGIKVEALIEINAAEELNKGGLALNEVEEFFLSVKDMNINVKGLMSVLPVESNNNTLEYYFKSIKDIYDRINYKYGNNLKYLSLGMSNDYELAIKCGSNMVRLGRVLFGERS